MDLPETFTFDFENVKLKSYRLLCLFLANKEIARTSDPDGLEKNNVASQLEREFFFREMSHLLLSIAITVRVLDDQMEKRLGNDLRRVAYMKNRKLVNHDHKCMLFENDVSLREACNKIIHAETVEPHFQKKLKGHQLDEFNWLAWCEVQNETLGKSLTKPVPIAWECLTAYVRLTGRWNKKNWYYLLDIREFVNAASRVFAI